jgi:hypothetical protein
MKFLDETIKLNEYIEVGDLIIGNEGKFLVIFDEVNESFPYRILNIESCKAINGYKTLAYMRDIYSNKNIKLIKKENLLMREDSSSV